ncbi:MAG TPA: sigma-70 family RNA polymerase sigma factor [Actinomycetota bacterium]|nr:sigma-70 family RNA polymerase sigma factor [Actinomycetota bacterium]
MSFDDFYRSEYKSVFGAAYLATGDREASADIAQEAFKRAFMRWKRLRDETWAGGWVMRTALNLCKKWGRANSRVTSAERERADEGSPGPSGTRVDVLVALRQLPNRQRHATILFYWGDLPMPVIADLMGIAEGTVKAHLAQARATLRTSLEVADV